MAGTRLGIPMSRNNFNCARIVRRIRTAVVAFAMASTVLTPAFAVTVNYSHRIGYYTTFAGGTSGLYNHSTTNEIGHYAQGDTGQSVGWRTFRTADGTGGSARELRHGDIFTISVFGDAPFDVLGMSFNDGASTGSWANRHSNTRGYVQTGANDENNSYANWYVHHNGTATDTGANLGDETDDIKIEITSSSSFNAQVDGGSWIYNLTMRNSPGNADLVDGYSIYYRDDWDGGGRQDAFWKATTSVENGGDVHFGGTTDLTPGYINDGLAADSTSTVSANKLFKFGSHTLTLIWTNDFTGRVQAEAGTLKFGHDRALGAVPGSVQASNFTVWAAATIEMTNSFTISANRGIRIENDGNPSFTVTPSAYTVTYDGIMTSDGGGEGFLKRGGGTLQLGGNNTLAGAVYILNGTLAVTGTDPFDTAINVGETSGSDPATLSIGSGSTVVDTTVTIRDGSSGIKKIAATESGTVSGTVDLQESDADKIEVDVSSSKTLTISGTMTDNTGGGEVTKTGAGTLVLSNSGNSHDKKFTISAGVLSISASRNLGEDPGGSYAGKVTFAGGTLKATETFTMHVNNLTTLDTGGGTIEVDSTKTLTYNPVISGSANLTKTGAGTLTMAAVNTYSGKTIINAGTVNISAETGLGANPGSSTADQLTINGGTLQSTATLTIDDSNRGVTLGASGGTIDVDSGTTLTLTDTIAGSGALTKTDAGQLTLNNSGNNTYSGATTISGGTVLIAKDSHLGGAPGSPTAGHLTISSGAKLEVNSTADFSISANRGLSMGSGGGAIRVASGDTTTYDGIIAGSGDLTKELAGTLVLGGNSSSYSGNITVSSGTLQIGSHGNSLGDATGITTVGSGNTLALSGSGVTIPEPITARGLGATTGIGAIRNITGNNTLSGRVTVNTTATRINSDAGTLTLDVSSGNALESTMDLTLGGSGNITINDPLTNAATRTLTKDGTGTLTLNGLNTFTNLATVSAGIAVVNGSNPAPFTVSAGAFLYGTGIVNTLTVNGQISGGTTSNTVGHLKASTMTLANDGRMQVNLSAMTGTAGTDWDLITVGGGSGTYTVNSTAGGDEFIIALKGNPSGFSSSTAFTNIIVDAGTATSFATNKFTVDTAEFTPALGGGSFTVDADSGNLRLIFIPGVAPDVLVQGNATTIPDGDVVPDYGDHTDYGDVLVDGGTFSRTFTITNSGSASLGVGPITTNAVGNPGDFIVTSQPADAVAVGGTTTFQVQFNPTASGLRYTEIQFTNNVAGAKNPYTFYIQGTGTYVEIAVNGNGNNIADGSTAPATSNHTDFGTIGTAGDTLSRTYTITNTGNRAMTLGNVTTSGTHAADFIVTTQPSSSVAADGSTTFVVQFNPSGNGLRTASLSFTTTDDAASDGLTENPFNFDVQGTGAGTGISNIPTTITFESLLGTAPSPALQAFSVTNVGLGTLTYDLSTNAAWLSVNAVSGSAAAGAGNIHTAYVALAVGMTAGTSNALITTTGTDGFTTNSPKTIAVTWTLSAITNPSAQTATADGAEMVRLAWTKVPSHDVLIVYQSGGAVSTDPTQGTSYSVGNTIGSGTVVYKGSGAALEHIVATGTAHHYKFYSINNNYYSPGVTANATTLSYQAGEIVEQFSYTNTVILKDLNGGQGFTNAWSLSVPNTNTDIVVDSVNFSTFQSSWPTERGNRIVVKTVATTNYQAFRGINTVNCGQVYIAALIRRQFDEGAGDNKFQVLSFMNGSTEVATVGKRGAGNDQFGTRSGSDTDLYGAENSFMDDIDFLVIGRYDFDTGVMSGIFYDNATSVPSNEPTYLVSSTDTPVSQITGIRIAAGAAVNGWPGECHFDEIRVARNWGDLLKLLSPVVTNYSIDGDNGVTDGQMTNGSYVVSVDLNTAAGVDTDGTPIATTFDLVNPTGTAVVNNDTFGFFTYNSASSVTATDVNHAITSANNALGIYTVRVSAVSSNGGQIIDNRFVGNVCTGTVMTFTVTDDDTAAPTFGVFTAMGRDMSGSTYTSDTFAGGFWVTGTVTDAFSGLFAASNTFTLSYNGGVVSSGVFAVNFSDGGATSGGMVSNNFPQALMIAGAYTLTVFSVDFDVDRPSDQLKATNVFSFTVVDPAPAPGLAAGPLTLTYSAMLGSDPASTATFAVTNVGIGTLMYTNYQTYGPGPSGWFTANPTNNSLAATASRIHTGWVYTASFTTSGTYVATNRLAGNQTNAAVEIVVTLNVTNIPAPTAVTATPSGAEFVALRWTEASGRQVMIVYGQTNAPSVSPTNGTAYAVGNSLGSGTVIYKGTAAYFEQVVGQGTTNFYNFYTINNDRYSLVSTVGATTDVYKSYEIVDSFSYTNSLALDTRNGGNGFTNAWGNVSDNPRIATQQFATAVGYPSLAGNTMVLTNGAAFRGIPNTSAGKLYVAFMLRHGDGASYAGLSLFNGASEEIFFGEHGGATSEAGIDSGAGTTSQGANTMPANTDYLIIARFDFGISQADMLIYTNGGATTVPVGEPATWHVTRADTITQINRIRLASGTGTRWDEVRVATNWVHLFRRDVSYPFVTNHSVNAGSDVTDAAVKSGSFNVTHYVRDLAGIETTNTTLPFFSPNFDILNTSGTALLSDEVYNSFTYQDSGRTVVASDTSHAGASPANITLGIYTTRVSVANSNGLTTIDVRTNSAGASLTFNVVDDDTTSPLLGSAGDWDVIYNLPDQDTSSGTTSTNEYAIRQRFVDRITALGSGHTAYLATYTFSAASACCGGAGPIIDALTTALDAGATVTMVVDKGVDTNLVSTAATTNSIGSLARRGTNPLILVQDDSASGIMHNKLGLFDYGSGNKRVLVASWNMTGAASSQQWNILLDAKSDTMYAAYLSEFTELVAGRFHDDPAKSHAHDSTTFSIGGSWGANYVRFAPFTNSATGANNAQRDITNFIHSATGQIVFALNKLTRMTIASQLVARCDAGVMVDGVMPRSDTDVGGDSASVYSYLTNTANYATTNRVRMHTAYAEADYSASDSGETDLVHAKYMIIDPISASPVVIHGSANWTFSALQETNLNDENIAFLRHAGIALRFLQNFQRITDRLTNLTASVQDESASVSIGTNGLVKTGNGTNSTWATTDGALAGVATNNRLRISLNIYDVDSGLSRNASESDKATNTTLTVANYTTDNVTNLSLSTSSAGTTTITSTSVWEMVSVSSASIGSLFTGVSNLISANIVDADDDRASDQKTNVNQRFGFLYVIDDDTNRPVLSGFTGQGRQLDTGTFTNTELLSGLVITGLVTDVGSGVYAGTSNTLTLSRDGSVIFTTNFVAGFSDGGATAGGSLSNTIAYALVSSAGAYTATVFSADYDIDRSGDSLTTNGVFSFTIVEAVAPGLGVGPLTLTYNAMLGSDPSTATFAVTNIGLGTLQYTNYQTYGPGPSGWFSANLTNSSLAATASRIHTGWVSSASFTTSGTYVATNRVAGNQTNSAQEIVVTLIVTNIPSPTSVSATNDGAELMRINAAEAAGRTVLVVHSYTNALTVNPTNGTAYAVGDLLGNGRVIFSFIGSSTVSNLSHVVVPGSTNFYTLFTVNNSRYSTSVTAGVTAEVYRTEIYEQFGYTNGVTLDGLAGGTGWTNSWIESNAGAYTVSDGSFTEQAGYPTERGRQISVNPPSVNSRTARRHFPAVTNGVIYMAFYVRYDFGEAGGGGDQKYVGASFMDGTTSKLFFGEVSSLDAAAGIDPLGNGSGVNSGANSMQPDVDYLVIGRYTFSSKIARFLIYTNGGSFAVPSGEPSAWAKTTTLTTAIASIDGIRFNAGATSVGTPGTSLFDEVRVATNWVDLVRGTRTYPVVTNFAVAGSTNVSDSQVAAGTFSVAMDIYDDKGVNTTNTQFTYFAPNYDIWNSAGIQIITDRVFSSFFYTNSGDTVLASNTTHATVAAAGVTIGIYTSRYSAINSNGLSSIDLTTLSNGTVMTFNVFDDDTNAPFSTAMDIPTGLASTNLTPGDIAIIGFSSDGSGGLAFVPLVNVPGSMTFNFDDDGTVGSGFLAYTSPAAGLSAGTVVVITNTDAAGTAVVVGGGGVGRSGTYDLNNTTEGILVWEGANTSAVYYLRRDGTTTYSGLSVGAGTIADMIQNLDNGGYTNLNRTLSQSGQLSAIASSNNWIFTDGTGDQSQDYNAAPYTNGYTLTGNRITRRLEASYLQVGGWSFTGLVRDTSSGVNSNGVVVSEANNNISPNFTVYNSTGTVIITTQPFIQIPADGSGITTGAPVGSASVTNTVASGSLPDGVYTAIVYVADNDEDRTGDRIVATNVYTFQVIPQQNPALAVGPLVLNYHTMLGNNATQQTFAVTNVGGGVLSYTNYQTYGPGPSGWFAANLTNSSLASSLSRIHTGYVNSASFTTSGTFVATNRVAGNQTNSAQEIVVTVVVSNIPSPTAASAVKDGGQMVRLEWTEASGRQVLIVHGSPAATTIDPTNGTAYAAGDALDGGTVIAKVTGSGKLEHIVSQGSTNFYRFYTINNDRYSTSTLAGATTDVYQAFEIVDQFAYTNATSLDTRNGGQGFTSTWSVSYGTLTTVSNNPFTSTSGYPTKGGNVVTAAPTTRVFRGIPQVTAGRVYAAFNFRTEDGGASRFAGMSFYDGTNTEEKFIGEGFTQANLLTVGGTTGPTPHEIANNTHYTIIAMYDFENDKAYALLYTNGVETIPNGEPEVWDVEDSDSTVSRITHIRLDGDVGYMIDELRVATNWPNLFARTATYPAVTNFIVNGGSSVTDALLTSGVFNVVAHIRDTSGVSTSTLGRFFKPNFDIMNPTGTQILTNETFETFGVLDSQRTLIVTDTVHAVVAPEGVTLGVYTGRVSAINSNGVETVNVTTQANGTALTFTVIDDDATGPEMATITSTNTGGGSLRFLHVSIGADNVSGNGAASNSIQYSTTDAALTNLSSGNPLLFWMGARDDNGIYRGNTDAATNSWLSVGSAIISNVLNYDATRSDPMASTVNAKATNVWSWITPLTVTEIQNLVTNTANVGSNAVVATWRDADADRPSDSSASVYTQGWLRVTDDDVAGPTIQNINIYGLDGSYTVRVDELTSAFGWSITGRISDASGINVNSNSTTQLNNSPYFELWDPNGNLKLTEAFDTLAFSDGGATTLSAFADTNRTALGGVVTGVWTARVIAADNDEDWGNNDHSVSTQEVAFTVVPGASLGGIARAPATFNITSSYNVVTGSGTWPTYYVTNVGSGTLNYSNHVTYSSASGWLTVNATNVTLIGTGTTTNHAISVDPTHLNPGSYSATITLNGDQTNAAQTVTVNITVFGYYVREIVEPATNAAGTLHNKYGGTGWTGNWSNNPSSGYSYVATNGSLSVPANYPSAAGGYIRGDTTSGELQSFRTFPTFSTGKLFVAAAINKNANNTDGFIGISLMDGSTEAGFFGKGFGTANFVIDGTNGPTSSGFGIHQSTYLIVGYYDFDTDIFRARAWNPGDTLPVTEPTAWSSASNGNYTISQVTGIRLGASGVTNAIFDEVRVAATWEELLNIYSNEPSAHATGLNFNNVTTGSMVVGWTSGNGANRIVVAREGAAVTFSPTDNVAYAFSTNWTTATDIGGGNKVVFNGSGTNFNFVGLTPGTQYCFRVFEYNGAGSTANYLTNGTALAGCRWTLTTEPAEQPTSFNAYQVSNTQISNTWVAAGGSPAADGYVIFRRRHEDPTNVPVDGVAYTNLELLGTSRILVVTPGSATTLLHTNLDNCTEYRFRIFSFRRDTASGETYNYKTDSFPSATNSTACDAPTIQSSNIVFNSISSTDMTISWSNGSGSNHLVVVRGTNAVNVDPTDGVSYTANPIFGSGSHLGSGNYVLYNGTGATLNVSGLATGVTYHFRIYDYFGSGGGENYNTNTANDNPASAATVSFSIAQDTFSRTNTATGQITDEGRSSGGSGWSNNWSQAFSVEIQHNANFSSFKCYPRSTSNGQVRMISDAFKHTASRGFAPRTSGKIYAAWVMQYGSGGSGKYSGLSFMNGTVETGFVGKANGNTTNALSFQSGPTEYASSYIMNPGSAYLIVARYDFENKTLVAMGMTQSYIQSYEPDASAQGWDVVATNITIDQITGIMLHKQDSGDVYFDEVRIGSTWESVMLCDYGATYNPGPTPSLIFIGTNYVIGASAIVTNLSDAELKESSGVDFAVKWEDTHGVYTTNRNALGSSNFVSNTGRILPNWDPLAVGATTNQFGLDRYFYATNIIGMSGAQSVTTYVRNAFSITNIDFSSAYFVTLSAEDDRQVGCSVTATYGEDVNCSRGMTINTALQFYVYDDDTVGPIVGTSPLKVMTNATVVSSQTAGTVDRFFLIDGVVTQTGMRVAVSISDGYSGIQRASAGTADTNMNLTIASLTTSNIANYSSSLSSSSSVLPDSTSVWEFASSMFTYSSVSAMWGGDGTAVQGQDLNVTVSSPDVDNDRSADAAWTSNQVVGIVRVIDDDEASPYQTNITYGGASLATRSFWVATNGVRLQGSVSGKERNENTGTDTVWTVTDDEMLNAGTKALTFAFGAADLNSGIARGTSGSAASLMHISIWTNWLNDFSNYNASASSPNAAGATRLTNVWAFGDATFAEDDVTTFFSGGDMPVYVTIPDADNDRTNDISTLTSNLVGYLAVVDDDVEAYGFTNLTFNGRLANLIAQGFENNEGWSNTASSSYQTRDSAVVDGTWHLESVAANQLHEQASRTRKLQFQTGSYLVLPPRNDPGTLFFWARGSAGGQTNFMTVDYWPAGSSTWINCGFTNGITGTNYMQTSFPIDYVGNAVTVRVYASQINNTALYLDDLSLTRTLYWTNEATVALTWQNPTADYSGILQFRYTNAATAIPSTVTSGVASATNSASFASTAEGIVTGYVFMVDSDADRNNDSTKGMSVPYVTKIDLTPPPRISGFTGTNGLDDTSEIDLDWSADANSPRAAGWRASDSSALSPWHTYRIYYTDGATGPTTNSTYLDLTSSYPELATNITASITMSNLLPGSDYRIAIAGVDRAGNIGNLSDTAVVSVANFVVTQGIVTVSAITNVDISWTATNSAGQILKDYDAIYYDSTSGHSDNSTSLWSYMTTVRDSYMTDRGSASRASPYHLGSTMRFYRVAVTNTWNITNIPRRASVQIYVTKPLQLEVGENWHSLLSIPDTNLVKFVFGTNRLPKATLVSGADGTRITWYGGATSNGQPRTAIYLSLNNRWTYTLSNGVESSGTADDMLVPINEGFNIQLPTNSTPTNLIMIGEVPTNVLIQAIQASNQYNIVSYTLPRRVRVRDLKLRESGFTGATVYNAMSGADELRILSTAAGAGSFTTPRLRVWLKITSSPSPGETNFYHVGGGLANNEWIEPDESIIIWRKGTVPMAITNDPSRFYTQPGRNINP